MRLTVFCVGLSILLVPVAAFAVDAEEHDASKNAALQYWPALVHLPDHPRLTQWEVASHGALTASVKDAEFLFEGSGIRTVAKWSVEDLRRGATMPYCEWGLPITGNPFVVLHHTQRSPTAIGLLLLSARLKHSRGDWNGAIDDLNAAWVFTGHVASDRTSSSWFVHPYEVENRLAPLAAAWLPDLEKPAVQRFKQHLRHFPGPPALSDVLRTEKDMWRVWFHNSLKRQGLGWVKGKLRYEAERSGGRELAESLEAALTSKQELFTLMNETAELFDEAAYIATLPLGEFDVAAAQFHSKVSSGNPVTRLRLGHWFLSKQRRLMNWKYLESKTGARLAMLEAAIALRLGGRDGFEKVHDPFGDGPFDYVLSDGGYLLTSQLTVNGDPVSMKFGQGAIPEVDKVSRLLIYDPDSDPSEDIRVALETARRENKRVLLQWGFNGCIPCYKLHRIFEETKPLLDILHKSFIHLAVDGTKEASKPLIKKYNVRFPGVPHLTVLHSDGTVLANVKASDQLYDGNRNFDIRLIQSFLESWAP